MKVVVFNPNIYLNSGVKYTFKINTMNYIFSLFFLATLLFSPHKAQSQRQEYYQIKIYTFDNERQQQVTDEYLKNAYLPALKKLNIGPVGVFKTRPEHSEGNHKTYVLIPFQKLTQLETITEKLAQNKSYLKSGKAYLEAAYTNPPYNRIESILLRAFENMPHMKPSAVSGPREDRVYELRSYEGATEALHQNKVDMFNKGGEVEIFEDLGFNAVFYGQVISGCHMPNLMYMTTFTDQKSRDQHWDAFRTAPAWEALKNQAQYQNNVSHSDIYFLYPTEYSDY